MAGRIAQHFIDDLLDRSDIVDIVSSRVPLKKTGKNFSACCPFHQEKTPSFSVSPDKQFYYCFGCGAGGNAISFVMDFERLDFIEAVEQIARHAGLEIVREESQNAAPYENHRALYELMERCSQFYQQQLRHHSQRDVAVNYLKNRGLSGQIAKLYQLGFNPTGWNNLTEGLASDDKEQQQLIDTGMLIDRDEDGKKSRYDRFRNRIMFPIRDVRGRTIGFGGRVLSNEEKPKYLNSPETKIYHKSEELYGLYEARQNNRELKQLLIVEGYMDVIALAQFGIGYAVATLGTATSSAHINKLFRQTKQIIFCFDGDRAGRAAADKALNTCLPNAKDGYSIRFLFLPEGEDPDSLVRQEQQEGFEARIKTTALPLETYLFEVCARDLELNSLDGQANFAQRALAMIDQIPEGIYRQLILDALSQKTGLSNNALQTLRQNKPSSKPQHNDAQAISKPASRPHKTAVSQQQETNSEAITPHHPEHYETGNEDTNYNPYDEYFGSHEPDNTYPHHPEPTRPSHRDALGMSPCAHASSLLINYPSLITTISEADLNNIDIALESGSHSAELLKRLIEIIQQNPNCASYSILGFWVGSSELDDVAKLMNKNLCENEAVAKQELTEALSSLTRQIRDNSNRAIIDHLNQQPKARLSDLSPSDQDDFLAIFKQSKQPKKP